MKSSMEVPQKIKNRTTIRSSNSTSGYLSHENKNTNLKDLGNIIYNSQDMQVTKVTIYRWMDEKDVACVCVWGGGGGAVYTHTHTHTHTQWNITQLFKKWKFVICNKLNGSKEYYVKWGFPRCLIEKRIHLQCRRHRRFGFDPWVGRSPAGGNGHLLHYSCLENSTERGGWQAIVHGVAKSWTQLSD